MAKDQKLFDRLFAHETKYKSSVKPVEERKKRNDRDWDEAAEAFKAFVKCRSSE